MKFNSTIERLETRRLLSASIVNRELIAIGTDDRDSIELRRVGTDDVRVTIWTGSTSTPTSQQTFDMDDFDSVRVEGLKGNDQLYVAQNGFIPNLTMNGGDGNDRLIGGAAGEKFDGGEGLDSLVGNGGDDVFGSGGFMVNDAASGGAGSDSFNISSDSVNTTVDGGAGDDNFNYSTLNDAPPPVDLQILGGADNDTLSCFPEGIPLHFDGGTGVDTIAAPSFDNLDLRNYPTVENTIAESGSVIGNDLDNYISFSEGHGVAHGGKGNDTLDGDSDHSGGVEFYGEEGNDTLLGSWVSSDKLDGGPGNDTIRGNGAGNHAARLYGPGDTLIGGEGTDTLDGDGQSTYETGEVFPNTLTATVFEDEINVRGTMGRDAIEIRRLNTGQIRVTIWVGSSSTPSLQQTFSAMPVVAAGFNSDDKLFVAGGADLGQVDGANATNLLGGAGNDYFYGSARRDFFDGGPGADNLFGNGGDDIFNLKDGTIDTANGGDGNDTAQADNNDVLTSIETVS